MRRKIFGLYVFILLSSFFIVGCQTGPARYNPSDLPETQLAYLYTKQESIFNFKQNAYVTTVYNSKGYKIFGYKSFVEQDRWTELYLAPDRYKFIFTCEIGNYSFRLEKAFELRASTRTRFSCETEFRQGRLGFDEPYSSIVIITEE